MNLSKKQQEKIKKITANIGDMNFKRRIETIVNNLEAKEKEKILDCGCGDGLFLVALNETSKSHLYGLDLDKKNLQLAKGYLKGKKINLILGDVTKMPFKDNFFDKIYSSEVLEHVPNDKKAIEEIRRVLKKGGKLLITVPNHNYPFIWDPLNKILEKLTGRHVQKGFWAGIWNQHLRLYYLNEIVSLIEKNGFKIEKKMSLTHYCFPFSHIIMYGLHQILLKGILPEKISRTADKFRWQEENQSKIIRLGYQFLRLIDLLNDNLPIQASSVNIFIKAQKI
jgi:2-polyprenyl-6-hydroxyphenyl methylase / 3-demethylubiquinone-9 3-methyltransferase